MTTCPEQNKLVTSINNHSEVSSQESSEDFRGIGHNSKPPIEMYLQNVEADVTELIYVGVKAECVKLDDGWLERVVCWEFECQLVR